MPRFYIRFTFSPNMVVDYMNDTKIFHLVESRSLSNYTFEFEDTIKQIVLYVKERFNVIKSEEYEAPQKGSLKYLLKYNDDRFKEEKIPCVFNTFKFQLPLEITKDIDIFEELYINITLKKITLLKDVSPIQKKWIYNRLSQGAGSTSHLPQNIINGNVLKYGVMDIIVYVIDGKIVDRGLLVSLRHEFNHLFENYIRTLKTNGNFTSYHHVLSRNGLNINKGKLDIPDTAYNLLIYLLHDNSELSARASQIYSDLEYIKSKRCNFQEDIKKTTSYITYVECSYALETLKKTYDIEKWNEYRRKFNYGDTKDAIAFKDVFLRKTEKLLKKYLQRIGAASTLYYDIKEKEEKNI